MNGQSDALKIAHRVGSDAREIEGGGGGPSEVGEATATGE
jgi:hypothetical protein